MKAQIVLENLGVHLPNRVLFEQINWTLYEGMRVTLAGRNGSGKSTLLRLMSGRTESSSGRCTIVGRRDLKIGYLDQMDLDAAVLEMQKLKDGITSPVNFISQRLVKQEDPESDHVQTEWRIRKTLSGLGFTEETMNAPIHQLSGGWLLRMFVASTLLDAPDILLLDEPTNHLDISSIQWLEEFLEKEFEGSLVLVTHDVSLQKRTTDSLAILHGGHFYFRKHQSDYLSFRESIEEEKRIVEKHLEDLDKRIKENQDFVDRYRAKARIASRAQSKVKTLKILNEEQKSLQDRLRRIRGFAYHLKFRFRITDPGGRFPVSSSHLSFRYSDTGPWILKDINLDITRGQKIAIIGDNGAGKTTLLNVLAERLKPSEGSLQYGHAVQIGYFGQHQLEEISFDESVIENLRAKAPDASMEQLRGWLGAFGFYGDDDITKKAKVLSGGERARLALLRILVTPINLCLLDEPTNHLDIETKELLKEAIRSFEGTVILVSHDREFIEDVADRIIHISNDHQLTHYPGDLNTFFDKFPQFVRHVERGILKHTVQKEEKDSDEEQSSDNTISFEERKRQKNKLRSLEKKIPEIEEEINQLSQQKEALDNEMFQPEFYQEKDEDYRKSVTENRDRVELELNRKMTTWESLSLELEELKQLFPESE